MGTLTASPHKMAAGAGRRRLLPAWMGAAGGEEKGAAAGPPPRAGRRRGRWPRAAAEPGEAAVFCMNEAELVDVALGVLAEGSPRAAPRGEAARPREPQPAPSSSPGSAAGVGTGGDRSPVPSSPGGGGAEGTRREDPEDALRYVREIFFT
uniref:Modulator of retrovirus infection-like protein n=1 Tax=Anas platyrhynchos TaxID=8839 RepID=A0A8B9R0L5_ANAPL